jgi:hypothetical protein
MLRSIPLLVSAAALALAVSASPSQAEVSADVNIRVGSRPAPVVVFDREPDVVLIPRTHVYSVGGLDYDLYRFGAYWYINDGGYWFRARSYRGPFRAIEYRYVPHAITVVPVKYRRHPAHPHGGPPGQMKKHAVSSKRGSGPDRVVLHDDGDVVVIKNGKKGKGK